MTTLHAYTHTLLQGKRHASHLMLRKVASFTSRSRLLRTSFSQVTFSACTLVIDCCLVVVLVSLCDLYSPLIPFKPTPGLKDIDSAVFAKTTPHSSSNYRTLPLLPPEREGAAHCVIHADQPISVYPREL